MSKRTSAREPKAREAGAAGARAARLSWRRLPGCRRGEAIVSFAFVFPLVLTISIAILEFVVVLFDYHRAGEATRRAARLATIEAPVADLGDLDYGQTVVCSAPAGSLACDTATVVASEPFDRVVAYMQAILPAIQAENVELTYKMTQLGDPATPGGILPLVTIRLTGLQHELMILDFLPGMPEAFTFPAFTGSYLAGGRGN